MFPLLLAFPQLLMWCGAPSSRMSWKQMPTNCWVILVLSALRSATLKVKHIQLHEMPRLASPVGHLKALQTGSSYTYMAPALPSCLVYGPWQPPLWGRGTLSCGCSLLSHPITQPERISPGADWFTHPAETSTILSALLLPVRERSFLE